MKTKLMLTAFLLTVLTGPLAAQPTEGPDAGHFYQLVSGSMNWDAAKTAAEGQTFEGVSGYLVSVGSDAENLFVRGLYPGSSDIWIGGVQTPDSATPSDGWTWVSGEAWSFTKWDPPNEPNDAGGAAGEDNSENCVEMWNSAAEWNDISCTSTNPYYVVEYDLSSVGPTSHTFSTDIEVAGGASHSDVAVTITCNGGLPLNQTATTPVTFTVTELAPDDACSIVVDSVADSGWEMVGSGCEFDPVGYTTSHECTIELQPSESDFNVMVDWTVSEEADPGVGSGAMVDWHCDDAWNGTTTTTVGGSFAAPAPTDVSKALAVTPDPNGNTMCYADLVGVGSSIEVDDGCDGDSLKADGKGASCAIYATAFFEGIPTLSQYGMAIMALLMLGVGFVGFRRFV